LKKSQQGESPADTENQEKKGGAIAFQHLEGKEDASRRVMMPGRKKRLTLIAKMAKRHLEESHLREGYRRKSLKGLSSLGSKGWRSGEVKGGPKGNSARGKRDSVKMRSSTDMLKDYIVSIGGTLEPERKRRYSGGNLSFAQHTARKKNAVF